MRTIRKDQQPSDLRFFSQITTFPHKIFCVTTFPQNFFKKIVMIKETIFPLFFYLLMVLAEIVVFRNLSSVHLKSQQRFQEALRFGGKCAFFFFFFWRTKLSTFFNVFLLLKIFCENSESRSKTVWRGYIPTLPLSF